MGYIIIVVYLLTVLISTSAVVMNDNYEMLRKYRYRRFSNGITHRRQQPVCVHGYVIDGRCQCEEDYIGRYCEKQKHCSSFRRYRNGTCPSCVPGYHGEYCEEIYCVNGEPSKSETKCECRVPYSGRFCDELMTNQVYGYYNRRVYLLGPLGGLSLIPMCALYIGCEYMSKKRRVKRVGEMLNEQNINISQKLLQRLLTERILEV